MKVIEIKSATELETLLNDKTKTVLRTVGNFVAYEDVVTPEYIGEASVSVGGKSFKVKTKADNTKEYYVGKDKVSKATYEKDLAEAESKPSQIVKPKVVKHG